MCMVVLYKLELVFVAITLTDYTGGLVSLQIHALLIYFTHYARQN